MRTPVSIKRFEKLFLASTAAALLAIVLNFDALERQAVADDFLSGPLFELIFDLLFNLLVWFSIVRRASNVFKWILVVLTAIWIIALPILYQELAQIGTAYILLDGLSLVLSVVAITQLFTREAAAWLRSAGDLAPVDPEDFS